MIYNINSAQFVKFCELHSVIIFDFLYKFLKKLFEPCILRWQITEITLLLYTSTFRKVYMNKGSWIERAIWNQSPSKDLEHMKVKVE